MDDDNKRQRARQRLIQQVENNGQDKIGSPAWLNANDTFDHGRRLADDEAVRRSEKLLEMLMAGRYERCRGWEQKKIDTEILCANLLANPSNKLVSQKPLAISLNQNDYTPSRYTKASYFICTLVKFMSDGGWIDQAKGNQKMKRTTRIWPTRKLVDFFTPFSPVDFSPVELVNLRDEQGNFRAYKDNRETLKIRDVLRTANLVNRNALVQFKTERGFQKLHTDLYVVFNRSFDEGGRLYTGKGGYQLCTKEERTRIMINRHHTVEFDFSGMQPRLLYALEKIQYPHDADPYAAVIGDYPELRPFAKQLLLALINAKSLSKAIASGNYALHLDYELYQTLDAIGTKTATIIAKFQEVHPDISKYFGMAMGLKMMRLDARIALEVVKHFTGKGIPILSIHDSFIVEKQHAAELKQVMGESFSKHTGGFTCPIK